MKRIAVTLLAITLSSAFAFAQGATSAGPRQDVPVTTVALFSSGVGYFEHGGIVRGNSSAELRFRASQMNDVLKSLVLQDEGGGHVSTIMYPSQDPLSKTLRNGVPDIESAGLTRASSNPTSSTAHSRPSPSAPSRSSRLRRSNLATLTSAVPGIGLPIDPAARPVRLTRMASPSAEA